MTKKEIGELIRRGRKRAGFTLEDIGKIIGVSRSTVSKWENGLQYPSGEQMILLLDSLDLVGDVFPNYSKFPKEPVVSREEFELLKGHFKILLKAVDKK